MPRGFELRLLEHGLSEYVITLARTESDEHAQIVMKVQVADGDVEIVELSVRPGSSGVINLADVPPVNFRLLAQAFLVRREAESPAVPAAALVAKPVAAPVAKPVPAPVAKPVAARTRKSGRAYRKMPEPAQVLKVLREEGTVVAMAKRFGVPRHTAQGWLARIRRDG